MKNLGEPTHVAYGNGPKVPIDLVKRMGKAIFNIVQPSIAINDLLERAAYECIAEGMKLKKPGRKKWSRVSDRP